MVLEIIITVTNVIILLSNFAIIGYNGYKLNTSSL